MDDFLRNLSADPLGETLLLVPSPYTSVAFTTIFLQQRRIIVREYWMMQQLTLLCRFLGMSLESGVGGSSIVDVSRKSD